MENRPHAEFQIEKNQAFEDYYALIGCFDPDPTQLKHTQLQSCYEKMMLTFKDKNDLFHMKERERREKIFKEYFNNTTEANIKRLEYNKIYKKNTTKTRQVIPAEEVEKIPNNTENPLVDLKDILKPIVEDVNSVDSSEEDDLESLDLNEFADLSLEFKTVEKIGYDKIFRKFKKNEYKTVNEIDSSVTKFFDERQYKTTNTFFKSKMSGITYNDFSKSKLYRDIQQINNENPIEYPWPQKKKDFLKNKQRVIETYNYYLDVDIIDTYYIIDGEISGQDIDLCKEINHNCEFGACGICLDNEWRYDFSKEDEPFVYCSESNNCPHMFHENCINNEIHRCNICLRNINKFAKITINLGDNYDKVIEALKYKGIIPPFKLLNYLIACFNFKKFGNEIVFTYPLKYIKYEFVLNSIRNKLCIMTKEEITKNSRQALYFCHVDRITKEFVILNDIPDQNDYINLLYYWNFWIPKVDKTLRGFMNLFIEYLESNGSTKLINVNVAYQINNSLMTLTVATGSNVIYKENICKLLPRSDRLSIEKNDLCTISEPLELESVVEVKDVKIPFGFFDSPLYIDTNNALLYKGLRTDYIVICNFLQ